MMMISDMLFGLPMEFRVAMPRKEWNILVSGEIGARTELWGSCGTDEAESMGTRR